MKSLNIRYFGILHTTCWILVLFPLLFALGLGAGDHSSLKWILTGCSIVLWVVLAILLRQGGLLWERGEEVESADGK